MTIFLDVILLHPHYVYADFRKRRHIIFSNVLSMHMPAANFLTQYPFIPSPALKQFYLETTRVTTLPILEQLMLFTNLQLIVSDLIRNKLQNDSQPFSLLFPYLIFQNYLYLLLRTLPHFPSPPYVNLKFNFYNSNTIHGVCLFL